jgi:hypothetical protein
MKEGVKLQLHVFLGRMLMTSPSGYISGLESFVSLFGMLTTMVNGQCYVSFTSSLPECHLLEL